LFVVLKVSEFVASSPARRKRRHTPHAVGATILFEVVEVCEVELEKYPIGCDPEVLLRESRRKRKGAKLDLATEEDFLIFQAEGYLEDEITLSKSPFARLGTILPLWLGLDFWSVQEGLLLLSGVSPEYADVDWDAAAFNVPEGTMAIRNASLLNKPHLFSILPRVSDDDSLAKIKERPSVYRMLALKKEYALCDADRCLREVKQLWDGSEHPEQESRNGKYRSGYFFSWANRVNLSIPWLDAAINQGLIELIDGDLEETAKRGQAFQSNKRKAPDAFVAALLRLFVEITHRTTKNETVFSTTELPGTKADLLEVASKFDEVFCVELNTFDSYIHGLCQFKRGSKKSTFYRNLFPEYFKQ
jgi:hypothetical protein